MEIKKNKDLGKAEIGGPSRVRESGSSLFRLSLVRLVLFSFLANKFLTSSAKMLKYFTWNRLVPKMSFEIMRRI